MVHFPNPILANAGTALMWAGMLHLVFFNAIIGIGEGALLSRLFKLPRQRCVWIMILANYFSSWAGWLVISATVSSIPMDLNNAWSWFWILAGCTYVLTLVAEWPFVVWCMNGTSNPTGGSIRASFIVQSASYLVLFGYYWMASPTSLYTTMHVVPPTRLALPPGVAVYYIDPADGAAYRRTLGAGAEEQVKVRDLHSENRDDRLYVQPSEQGEPRWDVMAILRSRDRPDQRLEVVSGLAAEATPGVRRSADGPSGSWFNFGDVPALGSAKESPWKFYTEFWAHGGISVSNASTGVKYRIAYDTPFVNWYVRNAVHLPGDKVLLQLGEDQICALDPHTREIALLWRGRGPVAVLEKPDKPKADQTTTGTRGR